MGEELPAAPDGLDAEVDQVRRADELEHVEDHDRLLDDHAEAERDQDHDRQQAEGVAGDARERDAAAVGEGAADHEDHAGAGDDDEDQGGEAEGEDLVEREHAATLVRRRTRVARRAPDGRSVP